MPIRGIIVDAIYKVKNKLLNNGISKLSSTVLGGIYNVIGNKTVIY